MALPAAVEVQVDLGERSYPIRLTPGGLDGLGEAVRALGSGRRVGVVTDERVERLHGAAARASLHAAGIESSWEVVPEGESSKSMERAAELLERFLSLRFDRGTPVVAFGGGVVGDLGGFVASMLLRGVPYIQVPTTLLAQVDSSVGGKTGVNSRHGKNLIGAFYQPRLVFAAMGTLDTLEDRDLRAGLAEVVKYGVIADADLFAWIERHSGDLARRDADALLVAVRRSCEIKADIVGRDERESGVRSLLNFGHTVGHALETVTGYGTFRHGEAVSMGMVFAARLSAHLGLARAEAAARVEALLSRIGLPTAPPPVPRGPFLDALAGDKKALRGTLKFIVMEEVGKAGPWAVPLDGIEELMESAVRRGDLAWE